MFMISSRDFTRSSCSTVTVVVTDQSSRRSNPHRWTRQGNGLQRGQNSRPRPGRTVDRHRAATWPPPGTISWPPTVRHRRAVNRRFTIRRSSSSGRRRWSGSVGDDRNVRARCRYQRRVCSSRAWIKRRHPELVGQSCDSRRASISGLLPRSTTTGGYVHRTCHRM